MNTAYHYLKFKLTEVDTDYVFERAGYFTYDTIKDNYLLSSFKEVDCLNAVSRLTKEGLLKKYYKTTCSECGVDNYFEEEDPEDGSTLKNLTHYNSDNECCYCGAKQQVREKDGSLNIVYTVGFEDELKSGVYFNEDKEEMEYQMVQAKRELFVFRPFAWLWRVVTNGFKRLFAKKEDA